MDKYKSEITDFSGDYRGVEPDGEHWITARAMKMLLRGEAWHPIISLEDGTTVTITIKHGPGNPHDSTLAGRRIDKLQQFINNNW